MKKTIYFFLLFQIIYIVGHAQSATNYKNELDSQNDKIPISVTIGGEFITTGTVPAFSGERVDQFITRIFNQYKLALYNTAQDARTLEQIELKTKNFALRDILLLRSNGDTVNVDLQKFRLTANFELNPYLMNDDVIIFPAVDMVRKFVQVSGPVNNKDWTNIYNPRPIKFQYVEGDKLEDALLFAGGISEAYDSVQFVEISRLSYDGLNENQIILQIDENLNFELLPGDRIQVLAEETNRKDYKVYVDGEVNRPGYIFITKNSATLREVILKAGGFKENADLNRSELIRGSNVFNSPFFTQEFDLMMMQRMSNISLEDSTTFLVDNSLRFSRSSTIIDFGKVLDPESEASKFKVKDGDYISVPEKVNLIYVFGQVLNPGYVEFFDGKDYMSYINQAGGLGKTARGDFYLIKGKSRAWIDLEENPNEIIEPGDFIWVAKEQYKDFDYYLSRVGSISSIVAAVATVILLFVQAIK